MFPAVCQQTPSPSSVVGQHVVWRGLMLWMVENPYSQNLVENLKPEEWSHSSRLMPMVFDWDVRMSRYFWHIPYISFNSFIWTMNQKSIFNVEGVTCSDKLTNDSAVPLSSTAHFSVFQLVVLVHFVALINLVSIHSRQMFSADKPAVHYLPSAKWQTDVSNLLGNIYLLKSRWPGGQNSPNQC